MDRMLDAALPFRQAGGMNDSPLAAALRERLKTIDAELTELSQRRERLARLRKSVEATLAEEEAVETVHHLVAAPLVAGSPVLGAPQLTQKNLSDWIVAALRNRPRDVDDLKQVLANAPMLRDHRSPGRAINFALVGLQKGGHVERLADGKWKLSSGASQKRDRDHPAPAG
jgi:hypothetical protein